MDPGDARRALEPGIITQKKKFIVFKGMCSYKEADVQGSARGNIFSVGLNNQNRPWRCWKSAGARDFNPEQEIYGFQRIVPIRRSGCARERAGEYFFR